MQPQGISEAEPASTRRHPPGARRDEDALAAVRHQKDERIALGTRELYVHYGDGMGNSRLVIPAAKNGTARNLNSVAKLASLASSTEPSETT